VQLEMMQIEASGVVEVRSVNEEEASTFEEKRLEDE